MYIIEVEIQMQVPQNIFPNTKIALFVLSALALEVFLRSESIIVHKKTKDGNKNTRYYLALFGTDTKMKMIRTPEKIFPVTLD